MKNASALFLSFIWALSLYGAPANAESVSFRVNRMEVDQTQATYLLFKIDAASLGGPFSYAALEYQVDGFPPQRHEIVDARLRGSYLIDTVSIPRTALPYEKTVSYRWIFRDESGMGFESQTLAFYNADVSSWQSLVWKSFDKGRFAFRYELNEMNARQCAERLEEAYSFLKAEYGRELPHPVEVIFYDGQVHAAMAQLTQTAFVGYADSYRNRITVLSPMRDSTQARSFFIHELAHLFDFSLSGRWPKDRHVLELHATYMELISDAVAEGGFRIGLANLGDERLEASGSGPGWWYNKYLAYGFFESLADRYAGGSREGLSRLLYADTGRSFDDQVASLAGRSVDELLADAVTYLKRLKRTLPSRDDSRALSLSVEASTEIESSQWLPISPPAFSDDVRHALISGNHYSEADGHGDGSVYLPTYLDDIMVLDLQTGFLRDMTRDPFYQGSPVWDGKGGAFFIGRYGVEYGVYRMDERNVIRERLWLSGKELLFLSLSADGDYLVVAVAEGMDRTSLYTISLGGRQVRRIGEYAFSVTSMISDGISGFFITASAGGASGALYRFTAGDSAMDKLSADIDARAVICPLYDASGVLFAWSGGYGLYRSATEECLRILLPDPELILLGAVYASDTSLTALAAKKTDYFFGYTILRLRYR